MKNWIRRWLGLDKIEEELAEISSVLIIGKVTINAGERKIFIGQVDLLNVTLSQDCKGARAEITLKINSSDILDKI
jgi:hypothetical protein